MDGGILGQNAAAPRRAHHFRQPERHRRPTARLSKELYPLLAARRTNVLHRFTLPSQTLVCPTRVRKHNATHIAVTS